MWLSTTPSTLHPCRTGAVLSRCPRKVMSGCAIAATLEQMHFRHATRHISQLVFNASTCVSKMATTSHQLGVRHMLAALWAEVVGVQAKRQQQQAQPARHHRPHAVRPPARLPACASGLFCNG